MNKAFSNCNFLTGFLRFCFSTAFLNSSDNYKLSESSWIKSAVISGGCLMMFFKRAVALAKRCGAQARRALPFTLGPNLVGRGGELIPGSALSDGAEAAQWCAELYFLQDYPELRAALADKKRTRGAERGQV